MRPPQSTLVAVLLLAYITVAQPTGHTEDNLPRKSSAPFKRTYLYLEGHAVDLLAREVRFPAQLEQNLGGNIHFVKTPVLRELQRIQKEYSENLKAEELKWGRNQPIQRSDSESKNVDPEFRRLRSKKVIAPAAGDGRNFMNFDYTQLGGQFFNSGRWCISSFGLGDYLKSHPKKRSISIESVRLSKMATRSDLDSLRRGAYKREDVGNPNETRALFRFFDDATRNGFPAGLLEIEFKPACGGGMDLNVVTPSLQAEVLVLENVSERRLEVGNFHVRQLEPPEGNPAIRESKVQSEELARQNLQSLPLFTASILKPGEKLVIPLRLILRHQKESAERESEAELKAGREDTRTALKLLRTMKGDEAISLVSDIGMREEEERKPTSESVEVTKMSAATLLDGLNRPPSNLNYNQEFSYGPALRVEAWDVDGTRYSIKPFDPSYVSYFSGFSGGSCPFVYCRDLTGMWRNQGTILTHFGSQRRESTEEIPVQTFGSTFRIREEEDEISYIDHVYLRVVSRSGETRIIPADDSRLAASDKRYVILNRGDAIDVEFRLSPDEAKETRYLGASGYYVPTAGKRRR